MLAVVHIALALAAAVVPITVVFMTMGRTQQQTAALAALFILATSMLGGSFVPLDLMPRTLQIVAHSTPQFWAMQGYQDIIVCGSGLHDVLVNGGHLLSMGTAVTALALARLRRFAPQL